MSTNMFVAELYFAHGAEYDQGNDTDDKSILYIPLGSTMPDVYRFLLDMESLNENDQHYERLCSKLSAHECYKVVTSDAYKRWFSEEPWPMDKYQKEYYAALHDIKIKYTNSLGDVFHVITTFEKAS